MSPSEPSARARVRRIAERGRYDRATIHAILDEGMVCHVAFAAEGRPFVLPMGYARDGARLVLHGSIASRLLRTLADGVEAAVGVTLLDGLVLARSTFHSSMNYRSVVAFGRARPIAGDEAKRRALDLLVEHLAPGRRRDARGPTAGELAATEVLSFDIEEASAKVRTGPPKDDRADLELPIWAGVVPLGLDVGQPLPAPDLAPGIEAPGYALRYRRPGAGRRGR